MRAKGQNLAKKCLACHSLTEQTNKLGPHLIGIVGRAVASIPNHSYSAAVKAYGEQQKIWDEQALSAYLENPKAVAPKTKMVFRD